MFPDGAENADQFLVYLDGVLQDDIIYEQGQDNNPQGVATVGGEYAIGCWTGGPINFYKGIIDDAAVFPFAMAAEDIASVAKRGLVRGQVLDVSPQSKLATPWGALKVRE